MPVKIMAVPLARSYYTLMQIFLKEKDASENNGWSFGKEC